MNRQIAVILLALTGAILHAQPAPGPDVLVLTNGDRLTGQFVSSTGGSVTFKSDMAGEVHIDWTKIREFHSSRRFAVIPKGVTVRRRVTTQVPQGTIAVTGQNIEVNSTPPQSIPFGNAANVIDEDTFQKAVTHNPNLLQDWTGHIAAGASLVEATQNSRTFTSAINLIRTVPTESWMDTRNRTTVDFSDSYGTVSQPNTPTIKTVIYHAGAERDQYFSPRLYAFAQAAFDHNFSQGLDLEQLYGGGIGWTMLKSDNQTLDLRASMDYVKQQFANSSVNKNLIASDFSETYLRKLIHGIVLNEKAEVIPAWNDTKAYSADASAGLTLPVYKRFGVSFNTIDTYLNEPPPGFKKNSFQFIMALTYSLQ